MPSYRHKWTREDEILALDLYFRVGAQDDSHPEVIKIRELIDPEISTINLKLCHIRHLNFLDPTKGMSGVSEQLRQIWNEYCHNDEWMRRQFVRCPDGDFRVSCRDLEILRRDAGEIIRRRTPPQKVSQREIRQAAMDVLYAAQMQNISPVETLKQLRKEKSSAREKRVFSESLLESIVAVVESQSETIEQHISSAANRGTERISAVEMAVMRAAVAELISQPQTGRRVVINEAVEIAKQFGSEGGHKIVNGVLDKVAGEIGSA